MTCYTNQPWESSARLSSFVYCSLTCLGVTTVSLGPSLKNDDTLALAEAGTAQDTDLLALQQRTRGEFK